MSGNVIVAPSGAGKTYAVLNQLALPHAALVDGDAVIHEAVGWPSGVWWEDQQQKDLVHSENWALIAEHAKKIAKERPCTPAPVVVFNGRIFSTAGLNVVILMPNLDEHLLNIERRVAAQLRKRRRQPNFSTIQPTDRKQVERNREYLLSEAKVKKIQVVSTFREAGILLRDANMKSRLAGGYVPGRH